MGTKTFVLGLVALGLVGCGKGSGKVDDQVRPHEDTTPLVEAANPDANNMQGELVIEGSTDLEQKKSGAVTLNISGTAASKLTCQLDSETVPCENGQLTLNLSELSEGSHRLVVVGADGKEAIINFCAGTCDAPNKDAVDNGDETIGEGEDDFNPGPSPYDPLSRDLQVGYAYQLKVPDGMHVTE